MLIRAELILHVARSNSIDANVEYRLVWCPYVTSGSDEVEYLFAVALGTSVSEIKSLLKPASLGTKQPQLWCQCTLLNSEITIKMVTIHDASTKTSGSLKGDVKSIQLCSAACRKIVTSS